ncbi:MAG: hypothetical protein ACRECO_05050, partial [Xanthobacteraceae bacterium]
MAYFAPEAEEYQRKRWLRPDAERWWRPDAARWMTPEEARLFLPESMQVKERPPSQPLARAEGLSREERAHLRELLRMRAELAEIRFELRMRELRRKANFNPKQPRVPTGNPDGGQWTSDGGGLPINDSRVISDASPDPVRSGAQYAELKRPGIGHNKPPSDPPPKVPRQRPPTPQERHRIAREVARHPRWIAPLLAVREWLRELGPSLDSYNDPPKTFEELQQAAQE